MLGSSEFISFLTLKRTGGVPWEASMVLGTVYNSVVRI